MAAIEILGTGRIDERESAFPQSVQLPNGEILCSFGVGGGAFVHGGTDWARSKDHGQTWKIEGTILPPTVDPPTANFLKLSLSHDGKTVFAYGTRFWGPIDDKFGERRGETVCCRSVDGGHSWSQPQSIPMPDCPLEVSHSICCLPSGRLLAPAALLADKQRLGEEVFVVVSDDDGNSWPHQRTVFKDPAGQLGFWEQKLTRLPSGSILATAWSVTLGDYKDQTDCFAISDDDGWTWSPHQSTGIRGQTLSTLPLGSDRLLVLYNRRYGEQGIVMALVTFTRTEWTVHHEELLYDAGSYRGDPGRETTGVDELASFQFGFPTAIRLDDGTILATHWCSESGRCGIRWTRLAVGWK